MKTQNEPAQQHSLGKKVEPRPVIKPDWKSVPGKQYHYINAKGERKYAPPVPDAPMHPDTWAEQFRKAMGSPWLPF